MNENAMDRPLPRDTAATLAAVGVRDASGTQPWPAPDIAILRGPRGAPPAFPTTVLPPFCARFVAEASEGAGAPEAFVGAALLAIAGGVIGNARWVSPWPQWAHPPVFNVALIGLPSSGKSPALSVLTGLVTRLEAEDNADWSARRRDGERAAVEAAERRRVFEEEVKAAVKQGAPPPPMPEAAMAPAAPQRRRLFSMDPTTEKAARLSAANPRGLLLFRDELAGWLGNMNRYAGGSGGDRAFWLEAYNGGAFTPDRVRDGAEGAAVPHLAWSVIGAIPPDRVASLLLAGDDDGMMARFLPIWPERVPPRRPSAMADTEGAFRCLRRLRALPWAEAPAPRVVPVAEAALGLFDEWRLAAAELEAGAAGLMVGWLGKLPGLALRISLTLEYLAWAEAEDGTPEPAAVGLRAMQGAVMFLQLFAVPMARRVFGAAALPEAERDAARLAKWLARQAPLPRVVNARVLRQSTAGIGIPDAVRIEAALVELAELGWVREAPVETGTMGRRRKDWVINPNLAEVLPET